MKTPLIPAGGAKQLALKAAAACIAFCGVFATQQAHAIPLLQLYVEGATYTTSDASWTATATVGTPIKVWAVTNDKAVIPDVRLVISWTENVDPTSGLTVIGSTAGLSAFEDNTTPNDPTGSSVFAGGKNGTANPPLPPHGIFNQDEVFWMEYQLGAMSAKDTKIADFNSDFAGVPHDNKMGQINAYEITFSTPVTFHFDLYGLIPNTPNPGKARKAGGSGDPTYTVVNAPFSHDAIIAAKPNTPTEPGPTPLPEPASLALIALGCVGLGGYRFRNNKAK